MVESDHERRILETGRHHYRKGDYPLAIRFFKVAIDRDWENIPGHIWLGLTYFQMGRFGDSIVCYERALEIEPEYAEGWNLLGNAFRTRGELYRALDAYEEACILDEDTPMYLHNQASTCMEVLEWERAARLFERIVEWTTEAGKTVDDETIHDLVFCLYMDDQPKPALVHLTRWIDGRPDDDPQGSRWNAVRRLLEGMAGLDGGGEAGEGQAPKASDATTTTRGEGEASAA